MKLATALGAAHDIESRPPTQNCVHATAVAPAADANAAPPKLTQGLLHLRTGNGTRSSLGCNVSRYTHVRNGRNTCRTWACASHGCHSHSPQLKCDGPPTGAAPTAARTNATADVGLSFLSLSYQTGACFPFSFSRNAVHNLAFTGSSLQHPSSFFPSRASSLLDIFSDHGVFLLTNRSTPTAQT